MPEETAPAPALTPAEAIVAAVPVALPDVEGDGKKRWLIVAGGAIPAGEKRPVIVVETREASTKEMNNGVEQTVPGPIKLNGYPTKAALYLRITPEVEFPADAPVITIGQEVTQGGFFGFTPQVGYVNVGPHPAWAGANLAWQKGATDIEIIGLTDEQKAKVQHFVDDLPKRKNFSADVKIRLT